MPPIEPPTTQNSVSMPSRSISMVCARTMSGMVMIGKSSPHSLAGGGIGRGRPGRAHAAADHVAADDEVAVGVERPAGTDHGLPPAGLAGDRMHIGDMLIAGQRMADQDGVGAVGIEFAIGLIGDLERRQIDAAIELQRLVHAELRHQRRRMIGLVGAILAMDRRDWVSTARLSSRHRPPRGGSRDRNQAIKKPGLNIRFGRDHFCPRPV